ncbi:hypothetical protein DFJ74DRAFT_427344 [Hyaloraphidium curvatum]|nr:hypothetical protein DFJ74DRAFT_427344 [Hyaloraphidium curvatum]
MDALESLWQRLFPASAPAGAAKPASRAPHKAPGALERLFAAFTNRSSVATPPGPGSERIPHLSLTWAQSTLQRVAHDYSDLFYAVAILAVGIVALHFLRGVLRALFAPLRYEWVGPRTRPKRYPKKILDALPPPYPNAWYRLVRSADMKRGEIRQVEACGRTIAVARLQEDRDGHPVFRAVDAACPHMGANLAEGRLTADGCIECPFHSWRFDLGKERFAGPGCGKLKEIPYSDGAAAAVPGPANHVNVYELEEANGIVFAWIDAEGRRGKDIPFRPYQHPKIAPNGRGTLLGGYAFHGEAVHYVRAHIAELPENGSDVSHFKYTHQESIFPSLVPFMVHDMIGAYDESGKPVLEIRVRHVLRMFGIAVGDMSARAVQCGPGMSVLHIGSGATETIIVETLTPVYPLLMRVTHTCYAPLLVPRPIVKTTFYGMILQYDRDAAIFDKKVPLPQPAFVKGESAILQYRRWFKQFYSANSQSLTEALEECDAGFLGGAGGWTSFGEVDTIVNNGASFAAQEAKRRRRAGRRFLDW